MPSAHNRLLGDVEAMVMGSGPPLVLLPGLAPENGRPAGLARGGELQTMAAYAKTFTVYWVGRPTGLRRGASFADLAAPIAAGLAAEFSEPVAMLGISTGGSFAQQLAADRPELVHRLVLVSSGGRLAGHAARSQQKMIGVARRGDPRRVMAAFAWDVVPPWRGRLAVAGLAYAGGLRLYPAGRDTTDLLVTLEAEADFDLRKLPTITAPTLVINGGKDQFYTPDIVRETHELIPGSQLSVFDRRGHITVVSDRVALAQSIGFLSYR